MRRLFCGVPLTAFLAWEVGVGVRLGEDAADQADYGPAEGAASPTQMDVSIQDQPEERHIHEDYGGAWMDAAPIDGHMDAPGEGGLASNTLLQVEDGQESHAAQGAESGLDQSAESELYSEQQ